MNPEPAPVIKQAPIRCGPSELYSSHNGESNRMRMEGRATRATAGYADGERAHAKFFPLILLFSSV